MGKHEHLFIAVAGPAFLKSLPSQQSMLDTASDQARDTMGLWWFFCLVMTVVYVLVVLFFLIAMFKRRGPDAMPILFAEPERERRMICTVSAMTVVTAATLFTFMVRDFFTGVKAQATDDPNPLRVLVIGHQWWWEVQYENENASEIVKTANEIHLPLGKAVQFDLQSADVIHSFWSPNFAGKKDLVPGHPTSLWFRPTKLGTFFGQCAEFCGWQHAHMRFAVVVQTTAEFQDWLKAEGQVARPPVNDIQRRGETIFMNGNCIMCHTISGTTARGTIGPDLTHIASQKMIAAGTLPNTIGHLGGWILDPQQIKPGVLMPQNNLTPAEFQALLAYLENLN